MKRKGEEGKGKGVKGEETKPCLIRFPFLPFPLPSLFILSILYIPCLNTLFAFGLDVR